MNLPRLGHTSDVKSLPANQDINSYSISGGVDQPGVAAFHSGDNHWINEIKSMPDQSFDLGRNADSDMANFFARPVQIAEYTWSTSVRLFQDFDPWTLYVTDVNVQRRLENFNLMRMKLHVKLLLNGNQFFYGRAIASYQPRHTEDSLTVNRNLNQNDLVGCSQRPHVFLNPTDSSGGEMVLPFFCPDNWISLPTSTYSRMGTMNVREINQLLHMQLATAAITVSVWCWAEDVVLSIPTRAGVGSISPEAGPITPEAGEVEGIISKPASTVAKVATWLTSVPPLAPYARATAMVATGIGNFAKILGFSRPPAMPSEKSCNVKFGSALAVTDTATYGEKLSLDSKQELCVDPRTVGLSDTDELALSYITGKESYLTTFTWSNLDATGVVLGSAQVAPMLYRYDNAGTNPEYHLVPMAAAAMMFQYWKGSITFRFQVVASSYHKGRFRVTYDPVFPGVSFNYNIQYNKIIDLTEEKDFEMTVSWGEHEAWKEVESLSNVINYADSGLVTTDLTHSNGAIALSVVNVLTQTDVGAKPAFINVFVRAGPDFELAGPTWQYNRGYSIIDDPGDAELTVSDEDDYYDRPPLPIRKSLLRRSMKLIQPEAGPTMSETVSGPDDDKPESPDAISPVGSPTIGELASHVFMGERIVSLRPYLKRFHLHELLNYARPSDIAVGASFFDMDFPRVRGPASTSNYTQTLTGRDYNYCNFTSFNWITSWYAGRRGGMKVAYLNANTPDDNRQIATVTRNFDQNARFGNIYGASLSVITALGSTVSQAATFVSRYEPFVQGAAFSPFNTSGNVEADLPFYSNSRFAPARANMTIAQSPPVPGGQSHQFTTVSSNSNGNRDVYALKCISGSDDYTCFFFIGVPILYEYSDPAPPV